MKEFVRGCGFIIVCFLIIVVVNLIINSFY